MDTFIIAFYASIAIVSVIAFMAILLLAGITGMVLAFNTIKRMVLKKRS